MIDISPLIRVVQIEHVRVTEAGMHTSIRSTREVGTIEANIGHTSHVVQGPEGGLFVIRIDFVFGIHPEKKQEANDNKNAVVAVSVSFELTYRIPENMSTSQNELAEFARVNGVFNAWPYFREFVHASLTRMGLPPIIIPVYRLSPPKRAASKPGGRMTTSSKRARVKPSPDPVTTKH